MSKITLKTGKRKTSVPRTAIRMAVSDAYATLEPVKMIHPGKKMKRAS